jgi:hypothetical protein
MKGDAKNLTRERERKGESTEDIPRVSDRVFNQRASMGRENNSESPIVYCLFSQKRKFPPIHACMRQGFGGCPLSSCNNRP